MTSRDTRAFEVQVGVELRSTCVTSETTPAVRQHRESGAWPTSRSRLMSDLSNSMPGREPAARAIPKPSICPTCGLSADNAVVVVAELTSTATYVDTEGHLWAVTWLEVA